MTGGRRDRFITNDSFDIGAAEERRERHWRPGPRRAQMWSDSFRGCLDFIRAGTELHWCCPPIVELVGDPDLVRRLTAMPRASTPPGRVQGAGGHHGGGGGYPMVEVARTLDVGLEGDEAARWGASPEAQPVPASRRQGRGAMSRCPGWPISFADDEDG